MKTKHYLVIILSILIAKLDSFAQQPCTVKVKNLQGEYTGDCKKGLAHGKGVAKGVDTYEGSFKNGMPNGKGKYVWANGDFYEGEWKMGAKDGKGKLSRAVSNGENVVEDGVWDNNIYLGEKLLKPIIAEKRNIDSDYYFKRLSNGDKFTITFTQNGNPALPSDIKIIHSSGNVSFEGNTILFINLSFPFRCELRYRSYNGIVTNDCLFDFQIPQQGDWILNMDQKPNMRF